MSADLKKLRLLYQDASMLVLSLEKMRRGRTSAPLFSHLRRLEVKARARRDRRQAAFLTAYNAAPTERPPFPIVSAAIREHGAAILTKEGLRYVQNR